MVGKQEVIRFPPDCPSVAKMAGFAHLRFQGVGSASQPERFYVTFRSVHPANGNHRGPKVRDRLCQIIRHHQLDTKLVKACATDFCGATILREAPREQMDKFVKHLADSAEKFSALLCQLNSYIDQKQGSA